MNRTISQIGSKRATNLEEHAPAFAAGFLDHLKADGSVLTHVLNALLLNAQIARHGEYAFHAFRLDPLPRLPLRRSWVKSSGMIIAREGLAACLVVRRDG